MEGKGEGVREEKGGGEERKCREGKWEGKEQGEEEGEEVSKEKIVREGKEEIENKQKMIKLF